jgi:Na+/H+ antiporter NhaD/arsenite permease-like protein
MPVHAPGAFLLYPSAAMNPNLRKLMIPAVVLGIVLIVVAVIYFADPAKSLPSFFPGHVSASSAEANHHHSKHGIAALVVALACFAFAWFQTGPKGGPTGSQA